MFEGINGLPEGHYRAFDASLGSYRHFHLCRCECHEEVRDVPGISGDIGIAWRTLIDIEMIPSPDLSESGFDPDVL